MSDVVERAQEYLAVFDKQPVRYLGAREIVRALIGELRSARADNERLRAIVPPPKEPPPITCALCGRAGWQQFESFLDGAGVRSYRCSWRPACRERARWPRGAKT